MLRDLEAGGSSVSDRVLIGLEAPDDAAVYALEEDRAIVSTLDFFTPIVDDPFSFGAIAAANALSDIYAMGARPLFALNIVAFPLDTLGPQVLSDILRGGREKAGEAGVPIIGGHSIDDAEPKYGMVIVGSVDPGRMYRKGGGRPGQRLILTKPIGTGVISTAIKQEKAPTEAVEAAIASMTMLNRGALERLRVHEVGALTDVTGFGLLGHAAELAAQSGVAASIESDAVPLLPGALDLAEQGIFPGGTRRNRKHVERIVEWPEALEEVRRDLLCDAQTSGGLLASVPVEHAEAAVEDLRADGLSAADIGELTEGPAGSLIVR